MAHLERPAATGWPRLGPGDQVRLVSPASTPTLEGVEAARAVLESWGMVVEVAPHALDRHGYLAGTDADRLADLDDAFRDPQVRALVTTRGGAGAYRIAEDLDLDAVRADPKPLLGFSDVTALHVALWGAGVAAAHGCLVGEQAVATARHLLVDGGDVVVEHDPEAFSARLQVDGVATGPLVGGHLSTLAHAVGAGLPSLAGAVLLLEDTREMGLGRVDRQLTQLRRSGTLDSIVGVALGHLVGFEGYEDRGWSFVEVLGDHLGRLGVPVLGGLPIGHADDQACVALGSLATIDTAAGTLVSRSPAT